MRKEITLLTMSAVLLAAIAGACQQSQNVSGDLSSKGTGDVSNPPAERRAFDADLVASCGPGDMTQDGASTVSRQPYLQQVGASGATVVWTTLSDGAEAVEVTLPDGVKVDRADAVHEAAVTPARGGRQLHARLESLEAATIYCYQLVAADGRPLTERIGFRTAPAAGTGAPVDFIVFGDSGDGTTDQQAVLEQIVGVPFDLIVHVGDIAYPDATRSELEEYVFDMYAEQLKHTAIFPASGNHEYKTEDALPWREVFMLPENGGAGGVERWYSFDWGDIHFTMLDTELVNATQAAWLDRDLAASKLPWKIVVLHRPPFSSGDHGSDQNVRELFVPLFEKHGVQLVLQGHDHNYERMRPQNGVVYVTSGGGGHGTVEVGKSDFTAYAEAVLQFLQIRVEGDTLALHAIDATGREFDSLVLTRPGPIAAN